MTMFIIILAALVASAIFLGVVMTEVHFKNVAKSVTLDAHGIEIYSIGGGTWGSIVVVMLMTVLMMLILTAETYNYSQNVARDIDAGKYERVVTTTTITQDGCPVKADSIITFKKKP